MDYSALPKAAKIEWLLIEKFADWSSEDLVSRTDNFCVSFENQACREYYDELQELPDADLDSLWAARWEFHLKFANLIREARAAALFFNKPGAYADFTFWSKQIVWTVGQTIALSVGRNPDVVSYESLIEDEEAADSNFGREFVGRLRIAESYQKVGQLGTEGTPGEMLAWLQRAGLNAPPTLCELVQQMGHRIADWYSECQELEERVADLEEQRQNLENLNGAWQQQCSDLVLRHDEELATLRIQLADANRDRNTLTNAIEQIAARNEQQLISSDDTDPRRLNSALKVIYGIANDKYRFDVEGGAGKSAVSNIEGTLQRCGLNLSGKTIRSLLNEARQHVKQIGK